MLLTWFSQQGATMTENEEIMTGGQDFQLKFQDQGVHMGHPMTQRMKNQPKVGKPK